MACRVERDVSWRMRLDNLGGLCWLLLFFQSNKNLSMQLSLGEEGFRKFRRERGGVKIHPASGRANGRIIGLLRCTSDPPEVVFMFQLKYSSSVFLGQPFNEWLFNSQESEWAYIQSSMCILWDLLCKSKLPMFGPNHFQWRLNNQFQNLIDAIYSPIWHLLAFRHFFTWFHLVPASFFLWCFQIIMAKQLCN